MTRTNNSSSRINAIPLARTTRSRSSSFSSVTENLTLEPLTLNVPISTVSASSTIQTSNSNNDSTTVGSFMRCLQVSGIKNDIKALKDDMRSSKSLGVSVEERLICIERSLEEIKASVALIAASIGSNAASASSSEQPVVNIDDVNMIPFTPGGPYFNELGVSFFFKKKATFKYFAHIYHLN